jgi:hypothetical protein
VCAEVAPATIDLEHLRHDALGRAVDDQERSEAILTNAGEALKELKR